MDQRTCERCARPIARDASPLRRFCSDECRNAQKYEARKADGRYQRDLARDRRRYRSERDAQGVPPKKRYSHCQYPEGCAEKVYARALCRRHYRRATRKRERRTFEATCLAYRFGTEPPKVKPFNFRVMPPDRIVAFCPWCGGGAHAESREVRSCLTCQTRFVMNVEEALTVATSRPLSTAPLPRAS